MSSSNTNTVARPGPAYWIDKLQLVRHIEGGSFREVYRSGAVLPKTALGPAFKGDRNASTSIYFLLEHGQFSAFHRIASDECWHFYYGDPLLIYEILPSGELIVHKLGTDPELGQQFQTFVHAGSWFASIPAPGSAYALVGCTVAPGFDFADFELAGRASLSETFPRHAELIHSLTR